MNHDPSLCGFGKSTRAFEQINSEKSSVVYAAISIEQATDATNQKNKTHISRPNELIHSGIVANCTTTFCKKVQFSPCIATTHETLFNAMMRGNLNLQDTEVFIDELPSSITCPHSISCTFETFSLIQDYVEFVHYDNKYSQIKIKDLQIKNLEYIINKGEDDFWKQKATKNFATFLLSSCHNTYIPSSILKRLYKLKSNGKSKQIQALSVLTVDAVKQFKNFTILSALFQHTATFHFLKLFGHTLNNIAPIDSLHKHEQPLLIEYFLPKYSGKYRETLLKKKSLKTVGERIAEAQLKIANDNYIAFSNKKFRHHYESDNSAVLTTVFGHNSYSGYTTALFNSSTLPTPHIMSTMNAFGATTEMIYTQYGYLTAYQFMMRSALRDRANTKQCRFICVDKKTALFIQRLFKNSELKEHTLKDVNIALGIDVNYQPIPANIRKAKSTFMKKYNEKMLESTHKSINKSIEKYMGIMETYYPNEKGLFDFDKYRQRSERNSNSEKTH